MSPSKLAAIDWQQAEIRTNGNLQVAIHLIKQLLNSLPQTLTDIQQAAQHQNLPVLLEHVHKLHGASCYCSVPALKQAAKNLETALRQQPDSILPSLVSELEQQINRLVKTAAKDKRLR